VEKGKGRPVNVVTWIKSTSGGKLAWRLFIAFLGGIITFLGLIFMLTPGPGIPILLIGLAILATEFAWAKRAVTKAKEAATSAGERAPFLKMKTLIPVGLVVSLFAVGYWVHVTFNQG
jgi:hypothetical protein